MGLDLSKLVFVSTGAFFYWTLSGFKGTFNDYMSRYHDTDAKYFKNYWTGLALVAILMIIILGVFSD
jgi:hypothetical protein